MVVLHRLATVAWWHLKQAARSKFANFTRQPWLLVGPTRGSRAFVLHTALISTLAIFAILTETRLRCSATDQTNPDATIETK
ncbi:hypothetical protein AN189_08680 [Loktanella sp. 3ANDIMAR09]|nr:hypothetical protein AN189_08680 [Loktanella sp. 3ANDIMAR09]